MPTTQFDAANEMLPDYAAVQAELRRLLNDDPILYVLNRIALDHDWDELRALKSAVVMLAARNADMLKTVEWYAERQLNVITLPV